jgi:predicted nucleotidyltransferase
MSLLTEHQQRVADAVLDEECERRQHVVIALSGAHAYGFPSPDSDLDLKAIHVTPTSSLVGLRTPNESAERMEVIDGVEIDYSSNEIGLSLASILKGNGNFLERVLGSCTVRSSPEHEALIPLVRTTISKRIYRHYLGFATSQRREAESTRTAKRVLYVLRTALTGAHALRTGEIVPDLGSLYERYDFPEARALISDATSVLTWSGHGRQSAARYRSPCARAKTVCRGARSAGQDSLVHDRGQLHRGGRLRGRATA